MVKEKIGARPQWYGAFYLDLLNYLENYTINL